MAGQTYLIKRNGIYYCRVAIPAQYRDRMGKREHWQSLGIRSHQEAIVKVRRVAAELFTLMEEKQVKARKLQSSDIPIIAEQHYKVLMVSHEQKNAARPRMPKALRSSDLSEFLDSDILHHNNEQIEALETALKDGNYELGRPLVTERLSAIHEVDIESRV